MWRPRPLLVVVLVLSAGVLGLLAAQELAPAGPTQPIVASCPYANATGPEPLCSLPVTQECIDFGNVCFPVPSGNPAAWAGFIWCSVSGYVSAAISDALHTVVGGIEGQISNIWSSLNSFIAGIGNTVGFYVGGVFVSIADGLNNLILSVYNSVVPTFRAAVQSAVDLISSIVAEIYSAISNWLAFLGPFAPTGAIVVFMVFVVGAIWVTIQVARLAIAGIRTVINLA